MGGVEEMRSFTGHQGDHKSVVSRNGRFSLGERVVSWVAGGLVKDVFIFILVDVSLLPVVSIFIMYPVLSSCLFKLAGLQVSSFDALQLITPEFIANNLYSVCTWKKESTRNSLSTHTSVSRSVHFSFEYYGCDFSTRVDISIDRRQDIILQVHSIR